MLRQSKGGWNINSQKIVLTNGGGILCKFKNIDLLDRIKNYLVNFSLKDLQMNILNKEELRRQISKEISLDGIFWLIHQSI